MMRKTFLLSFLILLFFPCVSFGAVGQAFLYSQMQEEIAKQNSKSLSGIIVMEVNGKLYYIDNLEDLLSENNKNTCIYSAVNGDIDTLYKRLLGNCQQTLAREGNNVGLINKTYNVLSRLGFSKQALESCLITVESIRETRPLMTNQIVVKFTVSTSTTARTITMPNQT